MGAYFIDPDRMERLSQVAGKVATIVAGQSNTFKPTIDNLELGTSAGDLLKLCDEIAEEMGSFQMLMERTAGRVRDVANQGYDPADDFWYTKLEASLNDGVGSNGLDDSDSLKEQQEQIEKWLKSKPPFEAVDIAEKMAETAATGNTQALTTLSQALWKRLESVPRAEAQTFLENLGEEPLLVAMEVSTPPPELFVKERPNQRAELGVITEQLILIADRPLVKLQDPRFSSFLFQRYGLESTEHREWAADHLLKAVEYDPALAGPLLDYVAATPPSAATSEVLSATLRPIAERHPDALALVLNSPSSSINLVGKFSVGADGDDLSKIEHAFLDYLKNKPIEDASLQYGRLRKALLESGTSLSFDFDKMLTLVASGTDAAAKNSIPWVSLVATAVTMVKKDPSIDWAAEDQRVTEMRNAALLIMTATDPELAKVLLDHMPVGDTPPQEFTAATWKLGSDPIEQQAECSGNEENYENYKDGLCAPSLQVAENRLTAVVEYLDDAFPRK